MVFREFSLVWPFYKFLFASWGAGPVFRPAFYLFPAPWGPPTANLEAGGLWGRVAGEVIRPRLRVFLDVTPPPAGCPCRAMIKRDRLTGDRSRPEET
jgi:hypothetical protein